MTKEQEDWLVAEVMDSMKMSETEELRYLRSSLCRCTKIRVLFAIASAWCRCYDDSNIKQNTENKTKKSGTVYTGFFLYL